MSQFQSILNDSTKLFYSLRENEILRVLIIFNSFSKDVHYTNIIYLDFSSNAWIEQIHKVDKNI